MYLYSFVHIVASVTEPILDFFSVKTRFFGKCEFFKKIFFLHKLFMGNKKVLARDLIPVLQLGSLLKALASTAADWSGPSSALTRSYSGVDSRLTWTWPLKPLFFSIFIVRISLYHSKIQQQPLYLCSHVVVHMSEEFCFPCSWGNSPP